MEIYFYSSCVPSRSGQGEFSHSMNIMAFKPSRPVFKLSAAYEEAPLARRANALEMGL